MQIDYVGDLLLKSFEEIDDQKNFGETSIARLKSVLESVGLDFEMEIPTALRAEYSSWKKRL